MDCNDVKPGIFVRILERVNDPGSTTGMLIKDEYLKARRAGAVGQVHSYVPGHGGDVWFVMHEDGSVGAYGFPEMERIKLDKEGED
jgi:hypothetical protein